MKNICVFKRLLFINILCLLWLPNFCDIKHNDAVMPDMQTEKIVQSDDRGIKIIPSMQEKENYPQDPIVISQNVMPNVEYINNLESMSIKENSESILESPVNNLFEKRMLRSGSVINLDSSRVVEVDVINEPSVNYESSSKISADSVNKKKESSELLHSISSDSNLSPITEMPEENVQPPMETASTDKESMYVTAGKAAAKPTSPVNVKSVTEDIVHQPHYDGMPSFDEWKKMMLAEQEKGGGQKVSSSLLSGKKLSSQKRRRNYSSFECGAKIVASNSEAEGTGRILNELVDDYMLNPCKAKIWFVIELCESVQATQIELANFELFSSCPKDFAVYSSDNFPTRDWISLGQFTAAEQRVLQSFELKQEGFGKFIKIELLNYYGKEHYCPLSVVRIFGTSMVDEYEEMETLSIHNDIVDDDLDRLDIVIEDKKPTNLFGSAKDAVLNIVKKAAQALGRQASEEGKSNGTLQDLQNSSDARLCNVADQSQNRCETTSLKSEDGSQSLLQFPIPSSSMHHSLFRLLHRCDQCTSSRIRYYSSAQPHCRFFQAVLGPVFFQTLCDWFKEHPAAIAFESSTHRNKSPSPNIDYTVSPTKSPPPQVRRVSVENIESDISWENLILNKSVISLSPITETETLNVPELSSHLIANLSTLEEHKLRPTIQITGSRSPFLTSSFNESENNASASDQHGSVFTISSDAISGETLEVIPTETNIPIDRTIADTTTALPNGIDSLLMLDNLTEPEVENMVDFVPETTSAMEEIETMSTTEIPSDFKAKEEIPSDEQVDTQGKYEPVSISGISTVGQKESVFMRMSNRIKALEINMSLSSQYLQELSQRYRRQMEEMQRAFNRTIGTLNDTARKAAEKDLKQQEILSNLELKVENLTDTVNYLLREQDLLFRQMVETHVCLMIVQAIVMITIWSLCNRRISSPVDRISLPAKETSVSPRLSKRRGSVDSCTPPVARKVCKRSASEEALNAGKLLNEEPLPVLIDPLLKVKKRNKKRKSIQRSNSNPFASSKSSCSINRNAQKCASKSDGCIKENNRSKCDLHEANNGCENCNDNFSTRVKFQEKDRRPNGAPFQNLTNGAAIIPQENNLNQKVVKVKERFSFKKLLKFQKRDSI